MTVIAWILTGAMYALLLAFAVRMTLHVTERFHSNFPALAVLVLSSLAVFIAWPWWVAAQVTVIGARTFRTYRWRTTVLGRPGEQWCATCKRAMPMDDLIGHRHQVVR